MNSYGIYNPASGNTHVDSIRGRQNFNTQAALTDFFKDYQDGAESHFTFFPKPAGKGYTMDIGIAVQLGTAPKLLPEFQPESGEPCLPRTQSGHVQTIPAGLPLTSW